MVDDADSSIEGDYNRDGKEGDGDDGDGFAPCEADGDDAAGELPCSGVEGVGYPVGDEAPDAPFTIVPWDGVEIFAR